MAHKAKITLREAAKKGDLNKFIREHEDGEPGDLEKLEKALKRPASQKSKEAPKSLSRDNRDD